MVLLYEKKEKIATITLNRPKVLNAINLELAAELYRAWIDFSQDLETMVLIITGSGNKAFCVGADLKERAQGEDDMHVSDFWKASVKLPMRDAECYKPVIVAINGHCLAGGLELALMADIRIAAENATFGQPEINWGIFPGMGATQRLPRVLPYNLAAEIILTGRIISAQRAFEIGLVNHVVPLKKLMQTAIAIAKEVSTKAPLALKAVKEALLKSYDLPLDQGLRLEALMRRIVGGTADAREGMHAFRNSRIPVFKGK